MEHDWNDLAFLHCREIPGSNMLKLPVLLLLAVLCEVGFVLAEPTWTSLRVTWGENLFSPNVYAKLPRTESKARSEGFVKLAGECSGGKFVGNRYMKGSDTAAVLIYDANGYIAGIQNGIPKSEVDKAKISFSYARSAAYNRDNILGAEEVYFLTAYFVDPGIICKGRSRNQYDEEGTGTGLYFQNGTDPIRDSIKIPDYEKDMAGTKWVKGGCFKGMGQHYWYDTSENMNCQYQFPMIALYNGGKLTDFHFANIGNYVFSSRIEHPESAAFHLFMTTPVPKCLYEEYDSSGGYSTMHVYFTARPWNLNC